MKGDIVSKYVPPIPVDTPPTPKIKGVSPDQEIVTNEQGGKQSLCEYAFSMIPPHVLLSLADVYGYGAKKYSPNNWLRIPPDSHFDHMLTHYYAWLLGDDQDDHLGHFLCRASMLFETARRLSPEERVALLQRLTEDLEGCNVRRHPEWDCGDPDCPVCGR